MPDEKLLIGIDIGSTAVKVVAMTAGGQVRASAASHYPTNTPRPGWVEQDPDAWWSAVVQAVPACLALLGDEAAASVEAVSFSGHMSAVVLLDADGSPVMPSILIADTRSFEETERLRLLYLPQFVAMTGNEPIDAFAVSKLLWIQRHRADAFGRASVVLFPKDYIRYKFTGSLGTDPTDAGNSLLYDRTARKWADGLIRELGLHSGLFPELQPSERVAGRIGKEAARLTGLREGTPVVTGAADMACSQLGTGAVFEGTLAVTLSTSAQVVLRVTDTAAAAPGAAGRVTFHPSAVPDSLYAMGSIFTGGLGMDWGYRLLSGKARLSAADYEALGAMSAEMEGIPPGSGGLMFLPFLTGSGTPYFDSRDRASWLGLSTGQDPALLLHSVMEGVAYNIRESTEVFEEMGQAIHTIHLGGGGGKNAVWCRMIADVLGKDVHVLASMDASALGAAILAGVGSGAFASAEAGAAAVVRTGPRMRRDEARHVAYERIYRRYRKVYCALNEFYREEQEP